MPIIHAAGMGVALILARKVAKNELLSGIDVKGRFQRHTERS
jgi:hypothetical protein